MTWCGYIDILGAREAARKSEADLLRSLFRLHSALESNFAEFKDSYCSAFSDGAFFKTEKFENFYPFYARVRNQLFHHGVFFRSSYLPGDIDFFDRETDEGGEYLRKSPPRFRSFTFGGKAPTAYQSESAFRGIGCTIDRSWDKEKHVEQVVKSFGVAVDGRRLAPFQFFDFAFTDFEISRDGDDNVEPRYSGESRILDAILRAAHSASAQSEKVGSYYVSVLSLVISSSDFSGVTLKENKIAGPYIFERFFGRQSAMRALKDIQGLHLILLRIFDKIYQDKKEAIPQDVEDIMVSSMMRKPKCFKDLASVPDYVISGKAKDRLIAARARLDNVLA